MFPTEFCIGHNKEGLRNILRKNAMGTSEVFFQLDFSSFDSHRHAKIQKAIDLEFIDSVWPHFVDLVKERDKEMAPLLPYIRHLARNLDWKMTFDRPEHEIGFGVISYSGTTSSGVAL